MSRKIQMLSVGIRNGDWVGLPDGYIMEYHEISGLTLHCFFRNITADELAEFSVDKGFEITFTDSRHAGVLIGGNIGFFTLKIGNLPYGDCVFSPGLYQEKPKVMPDEYKNGKGLALNILLIDTATGVLKTIRTIGLGSQFSRDFALWCADSMEQNISREEYMQIADYVFTKNTTSDLVKKAIVHWELPSGTGKDRRREERNFVE